MTVLAVATLAMLATGLSALEWLAGQVRAAVPLLAPLGNAGELARWHRGLRGLSQARLAVAATGLALVALSGSMRLTGTVLVVLGALGVLLQAPRHGAPAGSDGAERLLTTVCLVLGGGLLVGTPLAVQAALAFLAGYVVLEYVAAGLVKSRCARDWVSGRNVLLALRASSYGCPGLADALARRPILLRLAGTGVLVLETAAPAALVLPHVLAVALLGMLLLFHLTTAGVMGLNTFVLPYAATYPAVLHLNGLLSP